MWPSWFVTNICCIFLNIIDAGYTTSLSNYAITINEINSSPPPQKKKITQKFVKKRKHCPELCKKIRKIGLGLKKNKKHLTILILHPPPHPCTKVEWVDPNGRANMTNVTRQHDWMNRLNNKPKNLSVSNEEVHNAPNSWESHLT